MEENKDIMNNSAESSVEKAEEVVEETETCEEAVTEETVEETTDDELSEEPVSKPVKSKRVLNFSIIIAIIVFVGALVVFGATSLTKAIFFDNSVVGSWIVDPEYVKENTEANGGTVEETKFEQNTFVIFTNEYVEGGEENNVKVAKLKVGTAEYIGQYIANDNEDGTKTIIVSTYYFSGNFTQSKLSGNMFTGKELELKDDNNNALPLVSAALPDITVAVPDDFKVNDKLVGEWTDGEYGYVFTFNADGTAFVDLGGAAKIEGTYSFDDKNITIHYIQTDELDEVYTYAFDEETLIINGLGFTKVEK